MSLKQTGPPTVERRLDELFDVTSLRTKKARAGAGIMHRFFASLGTVNQAIV